MTFSPRRLALLLGLVLLLPKGASAAEVKLDNDTLRWGCDAQGGAPYVFQDPVDPNHVVGFEVDLAAMLADKLKVKAVPVQGQWDKLWELLDHGDFDIAMNGLEATDDKKRIALLSDAYYTASLLVTVKKGSGYRPGHLEDLKGKKIGTLPGSMAARFLERMGAEVKTYDGGQDDVYQDVKNGRTDGALMDSPVARYYSDIDPTLETLPLVTEDVNYAIAVPKDRPELLAAINVALGELKASGQLWALYEKWGIANAATAKLLGRVEAASEAFAPAFETWRAAVGSPPPFFERVRTRYWRMVPAFAKGAGLTLAVSVLAMALAILLGVMLALMRVYGPLPLRALAAIYVEVMRGTPLLVQLIMLYFGLPQLGIRLDPFVAGVLALGLNYAAAEAENYRAGLESIPTGQLEAATVLGLSRWQSLRHVLLPQALRVSLPPMTNDFIALLKDSSLVSIVTLTELNKTYMVMASATRDHLGLGLMVAVFYLLLGLPFARLARYTEDRLSKNLRRGAPKP